MAPLLRALGVSASSVSPHAVSVVEDARESRDTGRLETVHGAESRA
jgi:hypothetical protein